ncbi:signal transduction histidine kinase [Cupriavidus basilensis OR16]|uniref:Signal transduction histidine kinase n=1 Tax=Cupriavidus basilensis OR16 TaxID=1127483 RepID=H1S912_9BURK|nr:HAMP domain-containing histidine kinase [Cupriavidus basilensis]EHP41028.1 signal transduction histidine kinase [Cupriavidus basilensis OR16]
MSQQTNPSDDRGALDRPEPGEPGHEAHLMPVPLEPVQGVEVATLIGQVAHDLRSALNGVQSWVYVLDRSLDIPSTPAQRALAGIRTGMQQQLALIEHMEEAVALLADDSPPRWEPIDLLAALGTAMEAVRPAAEARGLILAVAHLDGPDGKQAPGSPDAAGLQNVFIIDADPLRLDPLLRYLLEHCVRHARSADTIEAHLAPEAGHIRLRITECRAPSDARRDERIAVLADFLRRRTGPDDVHAPRQGSALLLARRLAETQGARMTAEGHRCSTGSLSVCISVCFPIHCAPR